MQSSAAVAICWSVVHLAMPFWTPWFKKKRKVIWVQRTQSCLVILLWTSSTVLWMFCAPLCFVLQLLFVKKKKIYQFLKYVNQLVPEINSWCLMRPKSPRFHNFLHWAVATWWADWITTWVSTGTGVSIKVEGKDHILLFVFKRKIYANHTIALYEWIVKKNLAYWSLEIRCWTFPLQVACCTTDYKPGIIAISLKSGKGVSLYVVKLYLRECVVRAHNLKRETFLAYLIKKSFCVLLSFLWLKEKRKKREAATRKGKLAGLIEVNKLLLFWLGAKKR